MSRRSAGWCVLGLLVASGCATTRDVKSGHHAREDLIAQIGRTETQLETAQCSLREAVDCYEQLVAPEQSDAVTGFDQFVTALDHARASLTQLDHEVRFMDQSADLYFSLWREGFEAFHSADMRSLSEQRLADVEKRYHRIGEQVHPVRSACGDLVMMLEDKQRFLETDLSPAALAFLRTQGQSLDRGSESLFLDFDEVHEASRRFVAAVDTKVAPVPVSPVDDETSSD